MQNGTIFAVTTVRTAAATEAFITLSPDIMARGRAFPWRVQVIAAASETEFAQPG